MSSTQMRSQMKGRHREEEACVSLAASEAVLDQEVCQVFLPRSGGGPKSVRGLLELPIDLA
eukprot:15442761-Alexandrium_andersonii.AAC.1